MNRSTLSLLAALATLSCAAGSAQAQQVQNPGDIIVLRTVTPRIAYRPVPVEQDPVAVRATTFPANTFDPMMATVVSDLDLTNARGSVGVVTGTVGNTNATVAAVTQVLTSGLAGPIGRGNAGVMVPTAGLGGLGNTISTTITGAISPLVTALGAIK
ncbi:hypothetical protein [Burkholderia gladioli]|uniref:hypothetical protein n=1 Tax=Burkholderia gladioli TaxID=28095 RepID=UPI0016404FDD|nr:hypothetical protein [Burkholderia gladioli]